MADPLENILNALRAGPFAVQAMPNRAAVPPASAKDARSGMVTLNINGKRVSVSENFLTLSPEEQNRTVDEIAAGMGTAKPAPSGPTKAQLKDAARKPYAAGDLPAAKRLVDAARKVGSETGTPASGATDTALATEKAGAAPGGAPIRAQLFDGTILEFPAGTDRSVIERVAKEQTMKRRGTGAHSPEMTAGLAKLSAMTQNPATALDAQRARSRTTWDAIKDNVIGDPTDGVDSYGEQAGRFLKDAGSATAAGIARGTASLVGVPGSLGDLFDQGMTAGGKALGIIPDDWQAPQSSLSGASMTEGMSNLTGGATDYRGESLPAKFAGTIGEFLPGALAFGGSGNLLKYGVIPGASSEAAGQLTEGTAFEPYARFAGAVAGGVLPDLFKKGASALISPYGGADPERLKLAAVLDDFGVPISAGQRTGQKNLMYREGSTAGGQRLMGEQQEAFTEAVLKTAGINAKRATPEVLDEAATRIGQVFDDVTRGVDVTPDQTSITALSEAVSTYKKLAPTNNRAPLVSDIFKDVTKAFRGGNTIPAATVNTWRSNLSKLTTSADAATREAARAALETIDDMLAGSLNAAGRAEDVARLATARGEWRNFLAIQKAAVREGDGLLSPARVRSAVIGQGESAYARGNRGDLGALARAGGDVMEALPNSGTSQRWWSNIPGGVQGLLAAGGATAGSTFGPMGTVGGAIAGAALPGVAGAVRMSGPMQAYLANQLLPKAATNIPKGAGLSILPFLSGH
ncbi:MAG: hypothetical protein ACLGIE_17055 [Alphaproteobacteria bacterium]